MISNKRIHNKRLQMAKIKRQKEIKEYYDAHGKGSEIITKLFGKKWIRCIVVSKKVVNNEYYFMLEKQSGGLHIAKIIYRYDFVFVPRTSKRYLKNKEVFDAWIKEVKEEQQKTVQIRYNYAPGYITIKNEAKEYVMCQVVLKKKRKGRYYFILKQPDQSYIVALLKGENYFKTIPIFKCRSEKTQAVFNKWIEQAKEENNKK